MSKAVASAKPTPPAAATALRVCTSTSSTLGEAPNTPTPAPAFKRKFLAYTSTAVVSASSTEPPATTLAEPQLAWSASPVPLRPVVLRVSIKPSVTFLAAVAALTRTLPALV